MKITKLIFLSSLILIGAVVMVTSASAHCDRVNGPVAQDARRALETGQFEHVAIWIGEKQEKELREQFNKSLAAYEAGGNAAELAEEFFMSESVRLHRAAEGMPFTGLKPASELPEDLDRAERALETGDVDPVVELLANALESEVKDWFQKARKARRQMKAASTVAAGRKWADAYVKYIVYVHKLYQKIQAGPPHGVGETH